MAGSAQSVEVRKGDNNEARGTVQWAFSLVNGKLIRKSERCSKPVPHKRMTELSDTNSMATRVALAPRHRVFVLHQIPSIRSILLAVSSMQHALANRVQVRECSGGRETTRSESGIAMRGVSGSATSITPSPMDSEERQDKKIVRTRPRGSVPVRA